MGKHQPHSSNKYAKLAQPQLILDFHKAGILSHEEIIALTRRFLERSTLDRLKKILIITGKGLHSADGNAVIRPIVEKVLRHDRHVKNFTAAIRTRGGEGAFEINLN